MTEAKITVEQGSVRMVANLVDDNGEAEEGGSEEEEGSFKGDRHH